MSLENISDADLQAELKRREQRASEAAEQERLNSNRRIFALRDVLLPLMEHVRSSCSDEKPVNSHSTSGRGGYSRCEKCFLMGLMESDLPNVELELRFNGKFLESHAEYRS